MNDYVVIPATKVSGDFVELARTQKGRLFKKQILRMDESFVHPSNPAKRVTIDKAFAETMKKNFDAGVCDIVQVPLADDENRHVEDPLRNLGEVVDLTFDEKGIYAILDARKHADDLGNTLLGASAMMHLDYTDTISGKRMGPTLLHLAVTNRPYLTNLQPFEEIVAMSAGSAADTSGETPVVLIPAGETEEPMDLNQMLQTLKSEHGIDVQALQAAAGGADAIAALSNVIAPEGGDSLTITDIADAVIEMNDERVALSAQVETLVKANDAMRLSAAEQEVKDLIAEGRVLPKQKDTMVRLSMEDRDTFTALVPDQPVVALSAVGVDTFDAPETGEKMQTLIDRLAASANGK